jgi:hypothetical protein
MAKATHAQRRAVRGVLFERRRFRQLVADRLSIDVLMALDAGAQPAPVWVVQATGEPGEGVKEAVRRCRKVADAYRAMARDMEDLELPARDRRRLRRGLEEEAEMWDARARAWAAPAGGDVDAAVRSIRRHSRAAARAFRDVRGYLPSADRFNDRVEAVS